MSVCLFETNEKIEETNYHFLPSAEGFTIISGEPLDRDAFGNCLEVERYVISLDLELGVGRVPFTGGVDWVDWERFLVELENNNGSEWPPDGNQSMLSRFQTPISTITTPKVVSSKGLRLFFHPNHSIVQRSKTVETCRAVCRDHFPAWQAQRSSGGLREIVWKLRWLSMSGENAEVAANKQKILHCLKSPLLYL